MAEAGKVQNICLLYGFQIRQRKRNPEVYILNVFVPEACIFQVLDPITFNFIKSLKKQFSETKFGKNEQPYNLKLVKVHYQGLNRKLYKLGNTYETLVNCLIQAFALCQKPDNMSPKEANLNDFVSMGIEFVFT